jgi:CRISPR-associated endoribonuclease Cas6
MRLKLTLIQKNPGQFIPINYNYPVSSFIYRTIERSNSQYSRWLHESGFMSGNKKFKFFTFSMLNIPKREINGNTIKVLSDEVELTVSMSSEKSIEHFIIGMFENQEMKIYGSGFSVKFIEALPEPEYKPRMKFKTISPVVLSKKSMSPLPGEVPEAAWVETYLNPADTDYFEYFKRNLEEKYIAYYLSRNTPVGQTFLSVTDFRILNGTKSKLITIKEGRADQTKVRGWLYSFELEADPEFMRLGYQCGFGKLNSLGFGCAEVI